MMQAPAWQETMRANGRQDELKNEWLVERKITDFG
jgi:hypothetical protein